MSESTIVQMLWLASLASILWAPGGISLGEWRHFRGDDRLTGRSALKGRITRPQVLWRYDVASRETLVEVRFGQEGTDTLALPGTEIPKPAGFDTRWEIGGPWVDLDGDGRWQRRGPDVGDFLPARPGLERLEIEGNVNREGPAVVRLFGRKEGRWEQLWKRPQDDGEEWTEGLVAAPVPIAGDFDGDGRGEIAFQGWYWMYVLDAETGRMKAKAPFILPGQAESGRGYGWFGAEDLDGDGKAEFVILGDTQNQVTVMGWDAKGKFVRRWHRLLNFDAYRRISVVLPGTDPLHDIDGDGKKEIVLSVYNYDPATGDAEKDNRWHLWALDGASGETKLDLKDHVLAGLCDLDGDGVAEILATAAPAQRVPEPGTLRVYGFKGGRLVKRWQQEGEAFQLQRIAGFPLNANSSASGEMLALVGGPMTAGGRPVFFTRKIVDRRNSWVRITAWQSDGRDRLCAVGRLTGPNAEVVAVRPAAGSDAGVLIQVQTPEASASIETVEATARTVRSARGGVPMSPVAIGRLDARSRPAIVVQGGGEQLYAFNPYAGKDRELRWRRPGRGMRTGGGHVIGESDVGGVVLADLRGDGTLKVVGATIGPNGCARLVAYDGAGEEVWRHDFPEIPGKTPAHNAAGLTMWFSGRFTDPKRHDIVATPRPKSQEEAHLLRGTDGHPLWQRARVPHAQFASRPVGGSWMAGYDHDGDGLEDLVWGYPDLLYVLDGESGELLLHEDSADIFPTAPIKPYNAMPVIADFLGDGSLQILWGACDRAFGLLDRKGQVLWQEEHPLPRWPGILPGIGDVEGDGKLEILLVGQNDGGRSALACYEGATGRIKWTLPLPGDTFIEIFGTENTPLPPATADIDGDGRDECLFVIGTTLYAAGATADGREGRVLWSLDFPGSGRLGPPAVADVTGDGYAQIVLVGRDGTVYGVGDLSDPKPAR